MRELFATALSLVLLCAPAWAAADSAAPLRMSPHLMTMLLRQTGSESDAVRNAATLELSRNGPEEIPALLTGLSSPDRKVRSGAMGELLRFPQAVPAVLALLKSPNPVSREAVLMFMGTELSAIPFEEQWSASLALARDGDPKCRESALLTIGLLCEAGANPSDDPTVSASNWSSPTANAAWQRYRSAAEDAILAGLQDEDANVRFQALNYVQLPGLPERAKEHIIGLLSDDDYYVAEAAAPVFYDYGEDVVPALARLVMSSDPRHTIAALRALECMGPRAQGAVPALLACPHFKEAANENPSVIGDILANLGEAGIGPAIQLLQSPDICKQTNGLRALEKLGAPAIGALLVAADKSPALRRDVDYLFCRLMESGSLDPRLIPALMAMAREKDSFQEGEYFYTLTKGAWDKPERAKSYQLESVESASLKAY